MRKLYLFLILNFFTLTYSFADIAFLDNDLRTAKLKAAKEGKLIFLDFWASYCTPCRMMEEYTFSDPSVSQYVRDNYIPVKIDIQSFDGYDLKNQYKISLLPTIIVLNSKGVQVGRHEETFSASKFISVLKNYDEPKNRKKIAPNTEGGYNKATGYSNASFSNRPIAASTSATNNTEKPISKVSADNHGAKSNRTATVASNAFTIQIGAFSSEYELKEAINSTKEKYSGTQRMFVSKRRENNKLIYRILIGHFNNRQQATSFLQSKGIKGFVRALDAL